MRAQHGHLLALVLAALLAVTGCVTRPALVPGEMRPTGWHFVGAPASTASLTRDADGPHLRVTGDGKDGSYWESDDLPLKPGQVYELSFRCRLTNRTAGGGCLTAGPVFANRDITPAPDAWENVTSYFQTPAHPMTSRLRFGQYELRGTAEFADLRLREVRSLYAETGDLDLGDGESLNGNRYECLAPTTESVGNVCLALNTFSAAFNTSRWRFAAGDDLLYRHNVVGRQQRNGEVSVRLNWHRAGTLVVEASLDNRGYAPLGTMTESGSKTFRLPPELWANHVWVRLHAVAPANSTDKADAPLLQATDYRYAADVDGPPVTFRGKTHFVHERRSQELPVNTFVRAIGDTLPSGSNVVELWAINRSMTPVTVEPTVTVTDMKGGLVPSTSADFPASPTASVPLAPLLPSDPLDGHPWQKLRLPYALPTSGAYRLQVRLTPGGKPVADVPVFVPALYATHYGAVLPDSNAAVGLWCASSGWKVSRKRPVPTARADALEIAAAANETEAAQFVITPRQPLTDLTVTAGDLRTPQGQLFAAANVTVLRVGYVPVTRPTDELGGAGLWPDPLLPLRGPLALEAGVNQPFWVRVHVPPGTAPGHYAGTLQLKAAGYAATVPLRLQVYGFALPDRMTCETAVGFNTWGHVAQYQHLRTPQQERVVMYKYLENFSAHRLSPYDPVQLNPLRWSWPPALRWGGDGVIREGDAHGGKRALLVRDEHPRIVRIASYDDYLPLPAGGYTLSLWYKAKAGHPFLVSFNHFDAERQFIKRRNLDIKLTGTGAWEQLEQRIETFPAGAKYGILRLFGTSYTDAGELTGEVLYDDVSLRETATGKECLGGGDFEPLPPEALRPEFAWADWDKALDAAFGKLHFNTFSLRVPGLGGGTFQSHSEGRLAGFADDTPEYAALFGSWCRQVQEHLREKGWLDRAYVYWFDEPEREQYPFVLNGFKKLKTAAPDLRRMLTEQVEPELIGGPNLWCPVSINYEARSSQARQAAGDRVWWYVCTTPKAPYANLFIDRAAIEPRAWLWQTWERGIQGILVWETVWWNSHGAYPDPAHPQNPYTDPMSWAGGDFVGAGSRQPWGNGDGRLLYPPESAATADHPVLDGPVDSIRWELLRDGVEDYEYLVILDRLTKGLGAKAAGARRLLRTEDVTGSPTATAALDAQAFARRRQQIGEAIEALAR